VRVIPPPVVVAEAVSVLPHVVVPEIVELEIDASVWSTTDEVVCETVEVPALFVYEITNLRLTPTSSS
jgi:hypothetical protein